MSVTEKTSPAPLPSKAAERRIEAKPARLRVSAEKGQLFSTFRELWTYLWPHDRADLRMRIILATVLLIVAKLVTLVVPFTFKWATDACHGIADTDARCAVCLGCHACCPPLGT